MFKVIHIESGKEYTVYGISGVRFLVWGGVWTWIDMDEFAPAEVIECR
jgi:hypothetical protein